MRSEGRKFKKMSRNSSDAVSVICQSRVTLYSASQVVEEVNVRTKHHDDAQYICKLSADGSYKVELDDNRDQLHKGTQIILVLKDEQRQYLEESTIKNLVEEHCASNCCLIYLLTEIEDGGKLVEKCQLISGQKPFGPSRNHSAVGPKTDNLDFCETVKGILGDKVDEVTIGSKGFGNESHCQIKRKRNLVMNPNSAKVERLRKIIERGQNDEAVTLAVELLFDNAVKTPKMARWRKCAKLPTICCTAVEVGAAAADVYTSLK